jgi:hypothetical protein
LFFFVGMLLLVVAVRWWWWWLAGWVTCGARLQLVAVVLIMVVVGWEEGAGRARLLLLL